MPEIAEVELIRRGLEPLIGERLIQVEIFDSKLDSFGPVAPIGQRLEQTLRHGKRLGLLFEEGAVVSLHLRMTGSLLLVEDPRARLRLTFANGQLNFVDPRRFGTVEVGQPEHFADGLGPDLFALKSGTYSLRLAEMMATSELPAKAVLLDQRRVAGIGNYLADEALFAAKISPLAPASTLAAADWKALLDAARRVARNALCAGGATFSDYRQADGSKGSMQNRLKAYGRAGEPCVECGQPLAKTRVAGRGTTYCPRCQSR